MIKIKIKSQIEVYSLNNNEIVQRIKNRLTITNPKFIVMQRMGRWTGNLERYFELWAVKDKALLVPCGFLDDLTTLFDEYNLKYKIFDFRKENESNIEFKGILKDFQVTACNDVLNENFGVLCAPTGAGKTVMGLYLIAARKQRTLIIVHNKTLLNQWIERITTFLNVPKNKIGILGNGKKSIGDQVTVAIVNTVYNMVDQLKGVFGHIVVDECHRCPSRTFSAAVGNLNSKYLLGLTATPTRRDGLTKMIFWSLGQVRHKVPKKFLEEQKHILKPKVKAVITNFKCEISSYKYSQIISELTKDRDRNKLICRKVFDEYNRNSVCIVLSDRKQHCHVLQAFMRTEYGLYEDGHVLTGDNDDYEKIIRKIETGKSRLLFATGQLVGEGFDCKNLEVLFLPTPIAFKGRLDQYVGRILRPGKEDKQPIVYDFNDVNVPVLNKSFLKRVKMFN